MVDKKELKINEELLKSDIKAERALADTLSHVSDDMLNAMQAIGRAEGYKTSSDISKINFLLTMKREKENKRYRLLKGRTKEINGEIVDIGTWEGYCKYCGSSKQSISEGLLNLETFGKDVLERANGIGMTTRELRKLRKLDSDDQQVVISNIEASVGDRDAIVELIEDMSAKHVSEREELAKKLKDAEEEAKAADKVAKNKNNKINELEKQIAKRESATPMDKAIEFAQDIAKTETDLMRSLGILERTFGEIQQAEGMDKRLRVNQGKCLIAVKDWCDGLIDQFGLSDISEADDDLDWVARIKAGVKEIEAEKQINLLD